MTTHPAGLHRLDSIVCRGLLTQHNDTCFYGLVSLHVPFTIRFRDLSILAWRFGSTPRMPGRPTMLMAVKWHWCSLRRRRPFICDTAACASVCATR